MVYRLMCVLVDGIVGRIGVWIGVWNCGWIDGWVYGWNGGWMGEWIGLWNCGFIGGVIGEWIGAGLWILGWVMCGQTNIHTRGDARGPAVLRADKMSG